MAKEAETIEDVPELDPTQVIEGDLVDDQEDGELEEIEAAELRELVRKSKVYDSLLDQETTTGALFKDWKDLQAQAAEAKKEYDGAVLVIRALIRAQTEDLPLFDNLGEKSEEDADNSWREVELSSLDLSAKVLENLDAARLTTIGELADYSANGGRLTQVAGIGPAAAEKIEDALEGFWANHPGLGETPVDPLAAQFGEIFATGMDANNLAGDDANNVPGIIELSDAEPGDDLESVLPGDLIRLQFPHGEDTPPHYGFGKIKAVDADEIMVELESELLGVDGLEWAIARPAKGESSNG